MSKSTTKPSSPSTGVKRPIRLAPWIAKLFFGACVMFALPWLLSSAAVTCAVLVMFPEGQKRSGRSGTIVWNKNNTMRVFAFPSLVRNAYTTFVRANLADFSSGWRSLTQSQQDGWTNAIGITTKNRIGHYNLTNGKQLYVKLNCNLATIGRSPIADAPTPVAVVTPLFADPVSADLSATTITMSLLNGAAGTGIEYSATSKLSAGINRPGLSLFRTINAISDSSTPPSPAGLWTAYETKFGALAVDDVFFIKASFIDASTGQQSVDSVIYKVVVVA